MPVSVTPNIDLNWTATEDDLEALVIHKAAVHSFFSFWNIDIYCTREILGIIQGADFNLSTDVQSGILIS